MRVGVTALLRVELQFLQAFSYPKHFRLLSTSEHPTMHADKRQFFENQGDVCT